MKLSKVGDPTSIVLRKKQEREVGEAEKEDNGASIRVSKISNLRCKWGDVGGKRCLGVEFSDKTCSPLVIMPLGESNDEVRGDRIVLDLPGGASSSSSDDSNYSVKDHPTMNDSDFLDDLMSLLTAYHYRKPLPDSNPSVAVISTLRTTIQDGIFTSMQVRMGERCGRGSEQGNHLRQPFNISLLTRYVPQNYGDKLSADRTVWDLTRHEIDGSRVLKSRSFSPNISRFKVKTHVRMDIDTVWEHVSNWFKRPLYDEDLFRANILREVEIEGGGGELQIVYYRYSTGGKSIVGNREFLEGRLLIPPADEGRKRVGRIITYPIRSDCIEEYATSIPGYGVGVCKALRGTHHECAWFVTEFGSKGWCKVEVVVKMEVRSLLS